MVRSQPGYWTPGRDPVQKVHAKILTADLKLLFFNNENSAKVFVFHTDMGRKMAAQGGIKDKVLRVSMAFEKGRKSTKKLRVVLHQKRLLLGNLSDPWAVGLRVQSWAEQLREGRVRSRSEVAKKEGITRARVSQLWPLLKITREQTEQALRGNKSKAISLRTLIRFARNTDVKLWGSAGRNAACG